MQLQNDNNASSRELPENGMPASPIGNGWRPGTTQVAPGARPTNPMWLPDKEALAESAVQQALEQQGYHNVGESKWIIRGKVRNFRQAASEWSEWAVTWQFQLTRVPEAAGFPLLAGRSDLLFIAVEMEIWALYEPLADDVEVTVYVELSTAWRPEEAVVPLHLIAGNGGQICTIFQSPIIPGEIRDFQQPSKGEWEFLLHPDVGQGFKADPLPVRIRVVPCIEPLHAGEKVEIVLYASLAYDSSWYKLFLRGEMPKKETSNSFHYLKGLYVTPANTKGVRQYISGGSAPVLAGTMQELRQFNQPGKMLWEFQLLPAKEARCKYAVIDVEMYVPHFTEGSSGDQVQVEIPPSWQPGTKAHVEYLRNESCGITIHESDTSYPSIEGEVRGLQQRTESLPQVGIVESEAEQSGRSGFSFSFAKTKARGTTYYTVSTQVWTFRLVPTNSAGSLQPPVDVELRGQVITGQLHDGDRVSIPCDNWTPRTTLFTSLIRNETTGGVVKAESDNVSQRSEDSDCSLNVGLLSGIFNFLPILLIFSSNTPDSSIIAIVGSLISMFIYLGVLVVGFLRRDSLLIGACLGWLMPCAGAVFGVYLMVLWIQATPTVGDTEQASGFLSSLTEDNMTAILYSLVAILSIWTSSRVFDGQKHITGLGSVGGLMMVFAGLLTIFLLGMLITNTASLFFSSEIEAVMAAWGLWCLLILGWFPLHRFLDSIQRSLCWLEKK